MDEQTKTLIKGLLFYAEMLGSKKKTEEMQDALEGMGVVHDYYHSTLQSAREVLNELKTTTHES